MTNELTWLMLTAILASALWIPYIVGVNIMKYEGQEAYLSARPNSATWSHGCIAATVRIST